MLKISDNGIIVLSRGDSCELPLFINAGTDLEPIRFDLTKNSQAIIYLSIMRADQYFENGFLRKMYSKNNWKLTEFGDLIVEFLPKDTQYVMPGKYYYEVKADLNGSNYINTIIQKTEFWIQ